MTVKLSFKLVLILFVCIEECSYLTDHDITRFLIARDYNIKHATKMLKEHLAWANTPIPGGEETPRTIVKDLVSTEEELANWRKYFGYSTSGHDRDGCPIYWEETGNITVTFHEAKKIFSSDDLVRRHIFMQEFQSRVRMPHACEYFGREITQSNVVANLQNMLKMPDMVAINTFIRFVITDQNNYPERLKHFFLVNAPWYFTGIWALITPFINEKTANKFHILGSDFMPELTKYIDKSQIPKEWGGERENFPWYA